MDKEQEARAHGAVAGEVVAVVVAEGYAPTLP